MTPKEKVEELIFNLGIENGKYLIEEMLIVLNDFSINDIEEWLEVKQQIENYEKTN